MEAAAQEIASIIDSPLPDEEKHMLLAVLFPESILPTQEINKCITSSKIEVQDKIEHKEEANKKEDESVKSKWKEDAYPPPSSEQEPKAEGSLDPFNIIEKVLSILESDFTSEADRTSSLAAILLGEDGSQSKVNTATTSHEVEQQEKIQDSEERAKGGGQDNLHNDGTSQKIEDNLSSDSPQQEAKANVAPASKLNLKEKSAYNETGKDISPTEDHDSTSSSRTELAEEIDRKTDTKASRLVAPTESCRFLLENEVFTVKESDTNSDGKKDELTMHKQESACKHCHKLMFQESDNVLKAKCECTLSLIHEDCANAWSREKGNKCSYCEKEIENTAVTLSLVDPGQSSGENTKTPSSASKSSWCCLM